ncbi:MAG: hypothetical protein ACRYG7_14180 [Janthinobacterium lividum]
MKKRVTTPNPLAPPVPAATPPVLPSAPPVPPTPLATPPTPTVPPVPEGVLVKIKRPHIDLAYTTGEEVRLPEAMYAHYTALALTNGTDPYFEKL